MKKLIGIVLYLMILNAVAAPVLDQSFVPVSENGIASFGGTFSEFTPAQTITVGITGQLVGVDFFMVNNGTNNNADVILQIFSPVFVGDQLDVRPLQNPPLATAIPVSGSLIPDTDSFVSFDLSPANFNVTSGQAIVISLSSNGPVGSEFMALGRSPGGYIDGEAYSGAGLVDIFTNFDFGFRTFVAPTIIPVPATVWLFATGLIGLVGVARRKAAA